MTPVSLRLHYQGFSCTAGAPLSQTSAQTFAASAGDEAGTPGDIAARFVAARMNRRAVNGYPGAHPLDLARAYATQEAAIALFPDRIIGWKVGGVPPAQQAALGSHRVAGPIFAGNLLKANGRPLQVEAIEGGFFAIEAEFVARVGEDLPADKGIWTLEEAAERIDAVFIGIELAGSPLSEINDLGSAVVASDFGNNAGLIVGREAPEWRTRLDEVAVETEIDGVPVGRGFASSLAGGAMESVRFMMEHGAARGRPLTAGTLISTGAVTGVHRVFAPAEALCRFEGLGEIAVSVRSATPVD